MVDIRRPVISLCNITKRYGRRTALEDVTLDISPGITGLLGPNGSGKSTLIKCLLGLLRFQAGSASVLGHPLPAGMRAIRDDVGYLPEDDCFLAGLSGIESVTFLAKLAGLPGIEALRRAHEVLDYADIADERYREVDGYSTGMRQKLKFASAIVHDPQLLILDEPTTGLDPGQRTSLLSKIKTLAVEHNKSIVISTHILNDVRAICDRVAIMAKGKLRLTDSLSKLTRPVRPGVSVRLSDETEDATSRFREQLDSLEVQSDFDVAKNEFWCYGIDSEATGVIWKAAAEAGVTISHLSESMNSLESVFFNVIKEAGDAAA
ncbi:MAG TPA: ABC transporter ATP-binding protein [Planctomycetaceae bacterium]|nr:ABC transporter ATP-binding protein [Planctomycetaceae bacterium]